MKPNKWTRSLVVCRLRTAAGDRTCGLLLKYVRVLGLEAAFPTATLLERAAESGITAFEMGAHFVVKGRRRQVSQPGMGSQAPSPQPGTSPIVPS